MENYADDYVEAIERLDWGRSVWECISAGGPIGQIVARKRPDLVSALVLASTAHRVDAQFRSVLEAWQRLVQTRQWPELYWNIAALNRRQATIARYHPLKPVLRLAPHPPNPQRFVRLIDGLLRLDTTALLPGIACPTLVIGGAADRIVSADLQREMAQRIPNSRLILYTGYGHAAPFEHHHAERAISQFIDGRVG